MNHFEYKGYIGSAEVDTEGLALVGKLLGIRDVIAYSASSPAELVVAFHEAVDEYLAACAEVGDEAETPFKGTFNVRVGPLRHREAALKARSKGITLNDFVCQALDVAFGAKTEHHTHVVQFHLDPRQSAKVTASGTQTQQWGVGRASTAH